MIIKMGRITYVPFSFVALAMFMRKFLLVYTAQARVAKPSKNSQKTNLVELELSLRQ